MHPIPALLLSGCENCFPRASPPLPSVRRCICRWIYVVLAALLSYLGNGRDNLLDLMLVLVHQP